MEGIIPMVYKTLKRNSTRRQYKPLSSSAAAPASGGGASAASRESYDINNFYPNGYNHHHHHLHYATPPRKDGEWNAHRRHKSFNFVNSGTSGGFSTEDSVKPKQLVRFRSHRMFSCITGA